MIEKEKNKLKESLARLEVELNKLALAKERIKILIDEETPSPNRAQGEPATRTCVAAFNKGE